MKEFLFHTLSQLDKLTGIKQLEKIYSAHPKKQDAIKEIEDLLDILCRTCDMFGYIPNEAKEQIISNGIISDPEFFGLNARIIFKWMSQNKGLHFKNESEKDEVPADYKPLQGDERDKAIETWLKSLKAFESSVKPQEFSGTKMKAALNELPVLQGYKPPSREEVIKHELHNQYIRENYDKFGKEREGWMSEEQWLELNT